MIYKILLASAGVATGLMLIHQQDPFFTLAGTIIAIAMLARLVTIRRDGAR